MLRKLLMLGVLGLPLLMPQPAAAQAVPLAGEWRETFGFWSLGSFVPLGYQNLCLSNDLGTTVSGSWIAMTNPGWSGKWRMNRDTLTLLGRQSYYITVGILELQPINQFYGRYTHFINGDISPNSNGHVRLDRLSKFCDKAAVARAAVDPRKDPALTGLPLPK